MNDDAPAVRAELVRALAEDCWGGGEAGLDRMTKLVTPGYVHHTPWGDWDLAQFRDGMAQVESLFTNRQYRVMHLVDDGQLVAAWLEWSVTRPADRSTVDGRGSCHCRIEGSQIAADRDAFFPSA
jgi:SnoaL-like domain